MPRLDATDFLEIDAQDAEHVALLERSEISEPEHKLFDYVVELGEGETLHHYRYGGALAARGGLFIRDANGQIVRWKCIWMS